MNPVAHKSADQSEIWLCHSSSESVEQLKIQRFKPAAENTLISISEPWYCKNDNNALSRLNDKWKHAKQPHLVLWVGREEVTSSTKTELQTPQRFWLGRNFSTQLPTTQVPMTLSALACEIAWLKRLKQAGLKCRAGIAGHLDTDEARLTMPVDVVLVNSEEIRQLKQGHRLGDLLPNNKHLLIVASCIGIQWLGMLQAPTTSIAQQTSALEEQVSRFCFNPNKPLNPQDQP
jgi:hypothetical protein